MFPYVVCFRSSIFYPVVLSRKSATETRWTITMTSWRWTDEWTRISRETETNLWTKHKSVLTSCSIGKYWQGKLWLCIKTDVVAEVIFRVSEEPQDTRNRPANLWHKYETGKCLLWFFISRVLEVRSLLKATACKSDSDSDRLRLHPGHRGLAGWLTARRIILQRTGSPWIFFLFTRWTEEITGSIIDGGEFDVHFKWGAGSKTRSRLPHTSLIFMCRRLAGAASTLRIRRAGFGWQFCPQRLHSRRNRHSWGDAGPTATF